jgi:hypothetical protein
MWPPVRAKLAGPPACLALMDAMEDEHKLIDSTDDWRPNLHVDSASFECILMHMCT